MVDVFKEFLERHLFPSDEKVDFTPLNEKTSFEMCRRIIEIMIDEPNVRPVSLPVTVIGDIHGQFPDLKKILRLQKDFRDTQMNFVFLGDYVDRGKYSVLTIQLLFALKICYKDRVTLIRGNHETEQVSQTYGFREECIDRFGTSHVWKSFCEAFQYLNLAAVLDNNVLCLHGGLSPSIPTIDRIRLFDRVFEPNEQRPTPILDLLWSDPEDDPSPKDNLSVGSAGNSTKLTSDFGFRVSTRGAGWMFTKAVTKHFCYINQIELVCRSHQLVLEGYKYMHDGELVTVWSAPNYCGRCENDGSILEFNEKFDRRFWVYEQEKEKREIKYSS